jgi:hypothetical protein
MPSAVVLVSGVMAGASLGCTAYTQWSGPTAGWAAPVFSFFGFLAFCEWLFSGLPAVPGPHDADLSRAELCAAAAGLLANALFVIAFVSVTFRVARTIEWLAALALGCGVLSVTLMWASETAFELRLGAYLWLGAIAALWAGCVRSRREAERSSARRPTGPV